MKSRLERSRREVVAAIVAVVCTILALPPPAEATHNVPVKAALTSVSFVTSYLPCTGGSLHDPASGVTNACPAVRRNPSVSFDGVGAMDAKLRIISPGASVGSPPFIAAGSVGPDARVEFRGSDLSVGGSLYSGSVFLMNRPRSTDDGCANSCTLIDLNGFYPYEPGSPMICTSGDCFGVFSINNALDALLPGTDRPVIAGIRQNGEERGVCMMTGFANTTSVFACHGTVVGGATGAPPPGFDYPRPSGASRTSNVLVRAYQEAVPGPGCVSDTHIPPFNIVPACAAVPSSNNLNFGPKGRGRLRLSGRGGSSQPRLEAKTKVRDVRDALTGNRFTGDLSLRLGARITHAACDGGVVCTLPDKDLSIPVTCLNGTCRGKGDLNAQVPVGTVSVIEHTPLVTGTPTRPCVYDGPPSDGAAQPFACVGVFIP